MSDWKAGSVKRRDARNTKSPNEVPKPTAAKKNTKKWCRGKVGVEHKLECLTYDKTKHTDPRWEFFKAWRILACTECGKEIDTYAPHEINGVLRNPPPPWVDK